MSIKLVNDVSDEVWAAAQADAHIGAFTVHRELYQGILINGRIIGCLRLDRGNRLGSMFIIPSERSKGYATEAKALAIDLLEDSVTVICPLNLASQAVNRKLGFVDEGPWCVDPSLHLWKRVGDSCK
jgi:RimJ/RimL family protein N-acetyltransferase